MHRRNILILLVIRIKRIWESSQIKEGKGRYSPASLSQVSARGGPQSVSGPPSGHWVCEQERWWGACTLLSHRWHSQTSNPAAGQRAKWARLALDTGRLSSNLNPCCYPTCTECLVQATFVWGTCRGKGMVPDAQHSRRERWAQIGVSAHSLAQLAMPSSCCSEAGVCSSL